MEKSTKLNYSKCKKDKETDALTKVQGKRGKAFIYNLNFKALEPCGTIRESHGIYLADKKHGLIDGSDSEHDGEFST